MNAAINDIVLVQSSDIPGMIVLMSMTIPVVRTGLIVTEGFVFNYEQVEYVHMNILGFID